MLLSDTSKTACPLELVKTWSVPSAVNPLWAAMVVVGSVFDPVQAAVQPARLITWLALDNAVPSRSFKVTVIWAVPLAGEFWVGGVTVDWPASAPRKSSWDTSGASVVAFEGHSADEDSSITPTVTFSTWLSVTVKEATPSVPLYPGPFCGAAQGWAGAWGCTTAFWVFGVRATSWQESMFPNWSARVTLTVALVTPSAGTSTGAPLVGPVKGVLVFDAGRDRIPTGRLAVAASGATGEPAVNVIDGEPEPSIGV